MSASCWFVGEDDGRPYFGYPRDSKGVSAEDALVVLIEDADILRQARELAEQVRGVAPPSTPKSLLGGPLSALLDLLAPVPDTGAEQ